MSKYIDTFEELKAGSIYRFDYTFSWFSFVSVDSLKKALEGVELALQEEGITLIRETHRKGLSAANVSEVKIFVRPSTEINAGHVQTVIENVLEREAWYVFPKGIYLIEEAELPRGGEETPTYYYAIAALAFLLLLALVIRR